MKRGITIKFLKLLPIIALALLITGCSSATTENPIAKEIFEVDSDADIIRLDDLIYVKNTDPDKSPENGYSKGEKIGSIQKKTTSKWWFRNLYASKLLKGTEVFSTDDEYKSGDAPSVILVEIDGELVEYHALIEG